MLLGALVFGTWIVAEALRQQAWLGSSFVVRFRTSNATGLWPGVHVTISGYRVGRVETVQLGPGGSVAVDLRIAERYLPLIGPASRALRYQEGLIGSSRIALTADPAKPGQSHAKTDRLIPFDESPGLAKLLVQIGETRLVLNRALQEFKRTGQRLESTSSEAQEAAAEAIREIRALAERANHLLGVPSATERSPASPSAKP